LIRFSIDLHTFHKNLLKPLAMPRIWTLFLMVLLLACGSESSPPSSPAAKKGQTLDHLLALMQGTFSSRDQAAADSAFFDINLVMFPIWETKPSARWLYVEQAATGSLHEPYRQRVYRVAFTADSLIESRVYELPGAKRFIHAWDKPELFAALSPDSLLVREGCAVFLKQEGDCFVGSTRERECQSSLRGASYATSKVEICPGKVTSWDQGWNDKGEQVWGAEKGGYVFKKLAEN
jgi:CpeT protein